MRQDTIYMLSGQLPGLYLPDSVALYSSLRDARKKLAEMTREYRGEGERVIVTHDRDTSIARIIRDGGEYPYYCHMIEPVSWKDIARNQGLKTRAEVLEAV